MTSGAREPSDIAALCHGARFTPTRLREGYHMGPVDDLLDAVVRAATDGQAVGPVIDAAVLTTWKYGEGYDMGEVDHFLATVRAIDEGQPVPAAPTASVVEEQRGWLSRIFGR